MKWVGRAPFIYNRTMTLADTEYSQVLPAGVTKVLVQCRGSYDMKMGFAENQSGNFYITIKNGSIYYEDLVDGSRTLYIQCPTAGQVAEILAWVR